MIKKIIYSFIFINLFFNLALFSDQQSSSVEIRKAVVQISSRSLQPDFKLPWKMTEERGGRGSGVIIKDNLILTNAHVVANSRFLSVEKEKDSKKYEAKVVFADHDCDLALIKVIDTKFYENTIQVPIGDYVPELKNTVSIYGYPKGGTRVSITEGVVSRLEYKTYVHTNRFKFLSIQTDAAINSGNSGGPAILDNKIIGIAFQSMNDAENMGFIISVPVIKHFLKDLEDDHYDGFPYLGVFWYPLENESLRQYHGLKKNQTGILVNQVMNNAPAYGFLKKNDVILAVEGTKIANDGSIPFLNGRLYFGFIVDNMQKGETINLTILRQGKEITVTFPLFILKTPIPRYSQYDILPRYFVYAGLIFQPMSLDYLKAQKRIDVRMGYNFSYHLQDKLEPHKKEFIVLGSVLKHPVNTYIADTYNREISRINGVSITSLEDVIKVIENNKEEYIVIELDGYEKPLILDSEAARKAQDKILEMYDIPSDRRLDTKGWYN